MATFSARLQQDEIFRSLVEREKIIIGAIRNQGLLDNLHYLKSVEEKIQGNHAHHSVARIRTWYYYAAAAVVALLIAVKVLLPAQQSIGRTVRGVLYILIQTFSNRPSVEQTWQQKGPKPSRPMKRKIISKLPFSLTNCCNKKRIRNIILAWQYKLNVGASHRSQRKFRYFN